MNRKIFIISGAVLLIVILVVIANLIFPPKGTFIVNAQPTQIIIKINNKSYQTPLKIDLRKGKYTVTAEKEGFMPQTADVTINYRRETKLYFDMVSRDVIEPSKVPDQIKELVHSNDHFSIEIALDGTNDIVITLLAILNAGINGPPMEVQEAEYNNQLKDYKKEALDWIKSKGVDPNKLKLKWLPEEAASIN